MEGAGLERPIEFVDFADAGGEEEDAAFDVVFVRGLDGLMDVAGGDGDGSGYAAAGDHALEVGGIGASSGEDFVLPGDLMLVGSFFHVANHAVVADDRGVHELDGDSFSEGGALFLGGGTGGVEGDGGIETEGEVGLDELSGGGGAAKADFFLHGEDGVEVVGGLAFGFFEFAQGLDEQKDGGAVVEGFDIDGIAELHERTEAGDAVANGDVFFEFFFGEAGVDEIVAELWGFVAFIGLHDVNGLAAHDADDVSESVDDDALGGEGFGIEATEGMEADEAFVVDVIDDEADLVHVSSGHDALFGGAAFFEGDDVAHIVDGNLIGEGFDFFEHKLADGDFESWGTWGFADASK